ncbi:hypothetical protein ACJ5NV_16795, partial [Loktanella agnita]|uniref:hypothetical protein n=1 Tax=Loktanella agnita TaxID=287097 RepID=UPI00398A2410
LGRKPKRTGRVADVFQRETSRTRPLSSIDTVGWQAIAEQSPRTHPGVMNNKGRSRNGAAFYIDELRDEAEFIQSEF